MLRNQQKLGGANEKKVGTFNRNYVKKGCGINNQGGKKFSDTVQRV